jgi:hypothetical protein
VLVEHLCFFELTSLRQLRLLIHEPNLEQ